MNQWSKGIRHWQIKGIVYISIPFTWLVPEALIFIKTLKNKKVIVGGPGALLKADQFSQNNIEVQKTIDYCEPITMHNPLATFTTRGCVNKCKFCAVPTIEGEFREIDKFIPRPIVCDNNVLASSKIHFNRVINKLKRMPYVDFNQGLEARLFTSAIATQISTLRKVHIRFAFDSVNKEAHVMNAIRLAKRKGFKEISCYLLFGFSDTPKEALYRAQLLRSEGVQIYPMRYQPLDSEKRNSYVAVDKGWTEYELIRFRRYWRGNEIFKMPFSEYDHRKAYTRDYGLFDIKDDRKDRWGI